MLKAALLSWVLPAAAFANVLQPADRIEDFEQIVSWVREDYGPLLFKQEKLGFDFAKTTADFRVRIQNETSDENFKYLLSQYVAQFKDAHFSLRYATKATAKLGFTTDLVQGQVVIDEIDHQLLPPEQFPFERGDEVVTWDGVAALDAARDLSRYIGSSYEPTALRSGVYLLASRRASRTPLPTGASQVTFKRRATGQLQTLSLNWHRQGVEPIGLRQTKKSVAQYPSMPLGLSDMCAEKSRIQPPAAAKIFTGVPFTAFVFPTLKGPVGFIRLPHYYPVNELGNEIANERFKQYESVLAEFEKTTVGLIIDQDFNCGGSIVYVNKLFSLFYGKDFEPQRFSFRASVTQVEGLRRQQNKFSPIDDGFVEFKNVVDEIEATQKRGLAMTAPLPMRGFLEVKLDLPGGNLIRPHTFQYTKPIVLLINEMSGSGGDAFPALMKDFGRARLLGTRTMGAGGHLWDDPHLQLKHSGGVISLTRSLIFRPNGEPLENFGVEPDRKYEITMEDYMNGYQNYLNTAVTEL